jgi:hypothetical protein
MSASREFERFEPGVTEQDQVRSRLIRVQAQLLQPSPKTLKIYFRQFFAHTLQPYQNKAAFR